MANISSKISSIEPDDGIAARAAALIAQPESDETSTDKRLYERQAEDNRSDISAQAPTKIASAPGAEAPSYGWINIFIISCALLWIVTAAIIIYSFFDLGSGLDKFTPLQWAGLSLFVAGPLLMIWVTGFALRQLARVSAQAHQLSVTAQQLLTPDETAVSRTGLMAKNIRSELDQVSHRVDSTLSRISSLQQTLDDQLQAINRTTYITENKSELIASRLSEEREALMSISSSFDETMKTLSSTLDTHGENLARSTKAAEQKIQEARISVEGATAKISSASDLVLSNTVEATSKLSSNQTDIARLGEELKIRATELDTVYSKHAADLAAMISDLRDEQENLGGTLEARLQKMRDMSLSAQVSAEHLTEASTSGRKTVEALADAARLTDSAVKQRFADMEEMVRYSNARAESISETAARRVQDSLSQTRKEIARIEYDMVALQDKLNRPENELPENEISAASATRRKKGISGLKPLAEDGKEETVSTPSKKKPKAKKKLAGLRPAPDARETFENTPKAAEALPAATPSEDSPKFQDPDDLFILTIPKYGDAAEPGNYAPRSENAHDLVIEPLAAEDFEKPDPDQHLLKFDPEVLRRTVSEDDELISGQTGKPRPPWWKSLLAGGRAPETNAIDQLTAVPKTPEPVSDANIVFTLAGIGLAPAAIVDDGCIIEAVNKRTGKGPLAMSEVITNRLEDPVLHLFNAVQSDPDLKQKITEFARRFHTSLSDVENNREAIRARLESDAGRAFLLCDAALNR